MGAQVPIPTLIDATTPSQAFYMVGLSQKSVSEETYLLQPKLKALSIVCERHCSY